MKNRLWFINHCSVEIQFERDKPPVSICYLTVAEVSPVSQFSKLTPDCRLVITKAMHMLKVDKHFITAKIDKLFKEGVT